LTKDAIHAENIKETFTLVIWDEDPEEDLVYFHRPPTCSTQQFSSVVTACNNVMPRCVGSKQLASSQPPVAASYASGTQEIQRKWNAKASAFVWNIWNCVLTLQSHQIPRTHSFSQTKTFYLKTGLHLRESRKLISRTCTLIKSWSKILIHEDSANLDLVANFIKKKLKTVAVLLKCNYLKTRNVGESLVNPSKSIFGIPDLLRFKSILSGSSM